MKTLYSIILTLFWCLTISKVDAQLLTCNSELDVSLDFSGNFELNTDMLLEGPNIHDTLWLSQTMLDCDDLGDLNVVLFARNGNVTQSCTTLVSVEDKTSPVAVCDADIQLALDVNGQATLTPGQVDDGSYDACGITSMTLSQTLFDSTDGPVEVVILTVEDASGNSNMCWVNVHILGSTPPTSLAANSNVFIRLPSSGSIVPSLQSLLAYGPFYGWDTSLELLDENDIVIPNNEITSAYGGDTITFIITEQNSGLSVWGYIHVAETPYNCDDFYICDNLPWSTPVGDCASGHSYDDFIEWPGDVVINSCYYSPDYLANFTTINRRDARPQLLGGCPNVQMTHSDIVFDEGTGILQVVRKWIIINWQTSERWIYDQMLDVNFANCSTPVIVRTPFGHGIENVNVYETQLTDEAGEAIILDNQYNSLTPNLIGLLADGVDILDALAIQEQLNGLRDFSPLQLRLADADQNGVLNDLDLAEVVNIATHFYDPSTIEPWMFFGTKSNPLEENIEAIRAGDYYGGPVDIVGGKRGDVNFDASNSDQIPSPLNLISIDLSVKDRLLNQGGLYTIDFSIEDLENIGGMQTVFEIDLEKIDIRSITSPAFPNFSEANYEFTEEDILRIFWLADGDGVLDGGTSASEDVPVLSIEVEALENSILSTTLKLFENQINSIARVEDDSRYDFSLNWVDRIFSNTTDVQSGKKFMTLFPNPANEQVTFSIDRELQSPFKLNVFNAYGGLMKTTELHSNEVSVNIQDWSGGLYLYSLVDTKGNKQSGLLAVHH